jgi:hypothetical protein
MYTPKTHFEIDYHCDSIRCGTDKRRLGNGGSSIMSGLMLLWEGVSPLFSVCLSHAYLHFYHVMM